MILERKPGDRVTVELYREGRKVTVEVTLGSR
jgi:S1-C subfamily serine protease